MDLMLCAKYPNSAAYNRYDQERVKRIEEMEGFKTDTPGIPL